MTPIPISGCSLLKTKWSHRANRLPLPVVRQPLDRDSRVGSASWFCVFPCRNRDVRAAMPRKRASNKSTMKLNDNDSQDGHALDWPWMDLH